MKSPSETGDLKAKTTIWELLGTAGGLGYLSRAPGTFGSLPGLLLGPLIQLIFKAQPPDSAWAVWRFSLEYRWIFLALFVLTLLGWLAIHNLEKIWQTHDDQRIVIDEVIGQSIALSFCPPTFLSLLLGFALFRLYDITKPGPIGWADRSLPGAWGTLLDDVIAGMAAAITLSIIYGFLF